MIYCRIFAMIVLTLVWSSLLSVLYFLFVHHSRIKQFAQLLGKVILKVARIPVQVEGLENLSPHAHIIMSNHASLFDIPILLAVLQPNMVMLVKKDLFRIPVFNLGLHALGYISTDRGKVQSVFTLTKKVRAQLARNISVCIFPEGTRSRDGQVKHFKKAPFLLAKHNKVDIIPLTIIGSYALTPNKKIRNFQPHPIKVIIHPEISHKHPINTLIDITHARIARTQE